MVPFLPAFDSPGSHATFGAASAISCCSLSKEKDLLFCRCAEERLFFFRGQVSQEDNACA